MELARPRLRPSRAARRSLPAAVWRSATAPSRCETCARRAIRRGGAGAGGVSGLARALSAHTEVGTTRARRLGSNKAGPEWPGHSLGYSGPGAVLSRHRQHQRRGALARRAQQQSPHLPRLRGRGQQGQCHRARGRHRAWLGRRPARQRPGRPGGVGGRPEGGSKPHLGFAGDAQRAAAGRASTPTSMASNRGWATIRRSPGSPAPGPTRSIFLARRPSVRSFQQAAPARRGRVRPRRRPPPREREAQPPFDHARGVARQPRLRVLRRRRASRALRRVCTDRPAEVMGRASRAHCLRQREGLVRHVAPPGLSWPAHDRAFLEGRPARRMC